MKKISKLVVASAVISLAFITSCKKEKCSECHYDDAAGKEVELGAKNAEMN